MYTQTYSRPLNVQSIIRDIKISEACVPQSLSPKTFPYVENYHNEKSSVQQFNGLLSALHKKLKNNHKLHFHSSTYRDISPFHRHKNFIEVVRSELEAETKKNVKERRRSISNSKDVQDQVLQIDFGRVKVGRYEKKDLRNRKNSLAEYMPGDLQRSSVFLQYSSKVMIEENGLGYKDASCNT